LFFLGVDKKKEKRAVLRRGDEVTFNAGHWTNVGKSLDRVKEKLTASNKRGKNPKIVL